MSSKVDDTSSDLEKINHIDDLENSDLAARNKLEKQLLRKLDLRMSFLVILTILNVIDRNNTPAARLHGFEKDLRLHGTQYSTVLSILFVGYILMQIPSNMFMNYLGKPSIYLPFCTILWGMISILTGITNNFVGALLCRFFLGFIEAAYVPGALFLLSKWYKRDELGVRAAILFCGTFISNAFGALLASWILDKTEGKLDQAAWRWLFYIEGAATITIAICGFFVLPDFPDTSSSWLSSAEKALAEKRMVEDAGLRGDKQEERKAGHIDGFIMAVTDWKVWWLAVILALAQLSLSFVVFFPTLTATLGYNLTTTLLLCAPPWVLTAIVAFAVTRHSDSKCERCWHSAVLMLVGILGFIIAICTMNTAARYASFFLMALSPIGGMCTMAWAMSSLQPANKRAVGIALINAICQLGLVAGPYAWDKSWGPTYRYSYAICISASGVAIVMSFIFRRHLAFLNEKAQREENERGQSDPGYRFML